MFINNYGWKYNIKILNCIYEAFIERFYFEDNIKQPKNFSSLLTNLEN